MIVDGKFKTLVVDLADVGQRSIGKSDIVRDVPAGEEYPLALVFEIVGVE